MKAILLAGGRGTRLWPLSKKNTPKQILSPFEGKENLLEITIKRTLSLGFDASDIFLTTAQDQQSLLEPIWLPHKLGSIISEPKAKNTYPAMLLSIKHFISKNTDFSEPIYVFPTDQFIENFQLDLNINLEDKLLCFRIIPTRAEVGYGYMKIECSDQPLRKVTSFKEKPDQELANQWYQAWLHNHDTSEKNKYFWNAGIYGFTICSFLAAIKRIDSDFYDFFVNSSLEEFTKNYERLPKISFDHAIAENVDNLYSTPLIADTWKDIGSWKSIHDILAQDSSDNIHVGSGKTIFTKETCGCLVSSDQNISIACAGIENIAIIIKDKHILVTDKNNPQAIQNLIQQLKQDHSELL